MKKIIYLLSLLFTVHADAQQSSFKITYYNFNDTLVPVDKRYITTVLCNDSLSASWKTPYNYTGPGTKKVESKNGTIRYEYFSEKDTIKVYCYKNFTENKLVFESEFSFVIRTSRPYSDSLHPFQWVIHNSQKIIGGQPCKKATMYFRGRNYTAWFAEAVPVNNGPWKFGGLPGLIFEIYDDTFTVYWTLHKMEKKAETLPEFPAKTEATFADFKKYYKERFIKVKQAIESHGSVSDPNCSDCKGATTFTSNTIEDLLNTK